MNHRKPKPRRSLLIALLASLCLLFGCGSEKKAEGGATTEIMVAAAASLRNVLPELTRAFSETHRGVKVEATYGASGDLKKQVEGGAPVDAVLFASRKPVEELVRGGKVDAATLRVVATNRLILIGPKGGPKVTFATLDTLPANEKIAVGDPGPVPAGQYAKEYLERLGKWQTLQSRLVLAGDVAAVLAYVRRGEAAAGVVYKTEAMGIADVVVLDEATGEGAPRAEVVGAVVKAAKGERAATDFLAFVSGEQGQRIFREKGFGPSK